MVESIADMMHRSAAEVVRIEWSLVERLIGAFAEETGRFPLVVHDDLRARWWCDGFNDHPPTPADWAQVATVAPEYHKDTDIPASKAMLVRAFEGTTFTWRWEERK